MALNAAKINRIIDGVSQAYACALGGSGYGIGALGASDRAYDAIADVQTYVASSGDADLQLRLNRAISGSLAKMDAATFTASATRSIYLNLLTLIKGLAIADVRTIDAYLSYLNYGVGGTNTALQSPYFKAFHYKWVGSYPNRFNLYFVVKAGTVFDGVTYTNALRKLVVGTGQTAGTAIPDSGGTYLYAGGVPYLTVSSFTGTSDTVTVTGTEYNPATGTYTTGKTWTATVNADGNFALTAGTASANALIVAVSSITAGGNILTGTIYAEAWAPSGRVAIPF